MAAEDCVTDLLTDIGAARDRHRRLLLADFVAKVGFEAVFTASADI